MRSDQEEQRLESVSGWYSGKSGFEGKLVQESSKRVLAHATGESVLEVGCGEGIVTRQLVRRFKRVVVVEGSERYAREVQSALVGKVELHHTLFESFFTEERFDTIILAHVLEHVEDPVGMLARCGQILNVGGVILVVVPNAGSIHRRIGKRVGLLRDTTALSDADVSIGHRRVYTLETLVEHVERGRLTVKMCRGNFLKPLANVQMEGLPEEVQNGFLQIDDEIPTELAAELLLVATAK